MSYFFSNVFTTALGADASFVLNSHVGMALFHGAPAFVNNDARYKSAQTVAQLGLMTGWVEAQVAGYPLSNEVILGVRTAGNNTYAMMSEFPIDDDMAPVQVRAVAFYYKGSLGGVTNPLIFTSSTPVAPSLMLTGGDAIAARPSTLLVGENQYLFGWETANPMTTLVEGPLATAKNAPEFEPAHTQHVWLYPQRVNFMANPSFEGGTNHWRTNGTASTVAQVETEGVKAGSFASGTLPVVVESNRFPALSPHFTVQLMARGTGILKVGLVTWPVEYNETDVDWGYNEEWQLAGPDASIHVQTLRSAAQPYECMLRLESDASPLVINNVMVENGYLVNDPHWGYFDGDTKYGARDDYSWYGGEHLKGRTYSCWYNNRRATAGRLFATNFVDRATVTSEEELVEGLVYQWVPAGVIVEPHWDVLYVNDLRHPIQDVAGTAVMPYKAAVPGTSAWAADMGVTKPWLT